ncbi:MAG: family 10 glycosylhydrolase [Sodaliphilus sp.]|nr:family 10 glycosylhydrolase [Sodaliphilus sp.]
MKSLLKFALAALLLGSFDGAAKNPKLEFRGAWLHIIGQDQYAKMTTAENKAYLIDKLNKLKAAGCNAIIWQVRPQADAAYPSDLEPWSRYISGKAGVAPNPMWNPLQFMIVEAHKRGMELHAWINPYRVTAGKDEMPAKNHVYYKHPEWFLHYADGKIYFDPGLPESRNFIDEVVKGLLKYDIDAIHMDDYFYPYPVKGVDFPDSASYAKYGNGMDRSDWRRHNVDLLIEQLHKTISATKPWVRLGISPFGIWRNKSTDPTGSATNGLQCYDALYADCPKWTAEGWVDYMAPQLYWALDSKAASTLELSHWWNGHANGRHMYYGQSVRRTMDNPDIDGSGNPTQLDHKIRLTRELPNVHGNIWWPGYDVCGNYKGIMDSLQTNQQSTIALIPPYTWIDSVKPEPVKKLKFGSVRGHNVLSWQARRTKDHMQEARNFVVYAFRSGEAVDCDDASAIKAVTPDCHYTIPAAMRGKYTFVVTVLDRCNNESRGSRLNVTLK